MGSVLPPTCPWLMAELMVKPLAPDTWEVFARLLEKHNGVWGGCWCLAFHRETPEVGKAFEEAGFTYERHKGKNHCVMRTTVDVP